jgi:hypothetical protein
MRVATWICAGSIKWSRILSNIDAANNNFTPRRLKKIKSEISSLLLGCFVHKEARL